MGMATARINGNANGNANGEASRHANHSATHFAIERHISRCAGTTGAFAILAIDHRANLAQDMAQARGRPTTRQDLLAFKQAAIRALAGSYTAVLTDPDYGFPALADMTDRLENAFGLIAPLEITDYATHPSQRKMAFIEHWGAQQILYSGGNGAKLLLFFHPESPRAAGQTEGVDRIVEACRACGLPFFLEPIACSLDPNEPLSNEERAQVTIETARHFSQRGVDVLKLPFPLNPDAHPNIWEPVLRALDEACAVPWTLLSGGVPFDVFAKQAEAACRAGASGVMAGQTIWKDGVGLEGAALDAFMYATARKRMSALAAICKRHGTPWHARQPRPDLSETWYAPGR